MPIYSEVFTAGPQEEKEYEIELEGDIVDMVRVRFPPGPAALLKVAFFYGNEQIWPYRRGTFFVGDNEVIQWSEYWPLPEPKTKITVRLKNEDDTYEHSVYVVINTKYRHETAEERLAVRLASLIRPIVNLTRIFTRSRW